MRVFVIVFILTVLSGLGCVNRSEVDPKTYGIILKDLPYTEAAAEPFKFPHAGDNDHRNCVFKEDDFF